MEIRKVVTRQKFVVNGKEYASLEEVPAELRALLAAAAGTPARGEVRRKYTVNGKEYASLEEVPEPFRTLLRGKDGDGGPGILEGKRSISGTGFSLMKVLIVQGIGRGDPYKAAMVIGAAVVILGTLIALLAFLH